MNTREIEKSKREKLRILIVTATAYLIVFFMAGFGAIPFNLGIVSLILLYIYVNFNLINLFFTSKRTTFKIYIFMILDLVNFFMTAFKISSIIVYLLAILFLGYLIIQDEGRMESRKIYRFMLYYTLLKIVFFLSMIAFPH